MNIDSRSYAQASGYYIESDRIDRGCSGIWDTAICRVEDGNARLVCECDESLAQIICDALNGELEVECRSVFEAKKDDA